MILANLRARFVPTDADVVVELLSEGENHAWFRLKDGCELHVYGPGDDDHRFFGESPCVGFLVEDFAGARQEMIASGIEFIGDPQTSDEATWNHYTGPDGNVYEIMSRP